MKPNQTSGTARHPPNHSRIHPSRRQLAPFTPHTHHPPPLTLTDTVPPPRAQQSDRQPGRLAYGYSHGSAGSSLAARPPSHIHPPISLPPSHLISRVSKPSQGTPPPPLASSARRGSHLSDRRRHGPVPVRAGAGRQPRPQNAGRAARRRRRRRRPPLHLPLLHQDPPRQDGLPDRRRPARPLRRRRRRAAPLRRPGRGLPPLQGRPGVVRPQTLALLPLPRGRHAQGVRLCRPQGDYMWRQLRAAAREGHHLAGSQGRRGQARGAAQRLDFRREARRWRQGRRARGRGAQPHRPRGARPAVRVRVRRRAGVQPAGDAGPGQHEAAHVHLQVRLPHQQRPAEVGGADGAGGRREGAQGVVRHGARPLRLPRRARLHGDALRRLAGDGPREPLQPGRVAHPPARGRRRVGALGPPRVLAGARRGGVLRQPRLPLRPPRPRRRPRRPHRGLHHRRVQGRQVRARPDRGAAPEPGEHPGMQPAGQRRLQPVASGELPRVRHVGLGGRRGPVQQAHGGGRGGARRVRGGRGGVRGAGGGRGPEHGRVQALLAQAQEGALAPAVGRPPVTACTHLIPTSKLYKVAENVEDDLAGSLVGCGGGSSILAMG
uniref:Uncharacterized protein n=1 Tax=Triticum urartu TaxID=4572 RepID=A0A8R7QFZ5_TRIUA